MKFRFYWFTSDAFQDGLLRPACTDLDSGGRVAEYLSNYCMDDGGLDGVTTLRVLERAIAMAEKVKAGVSVTEDVSRETWGAELTPAKVTIYFNYDEGYSCSLSLECFLAVLVAWYRFIQSPPAVGSTEEVDIEPWQCGSP